MRNKPLPRVVVVMLVTGVCAISAHATDWLQFGYDTAHSSYNRAETGYSTPTGNSVLYNYTLPSAAGTADSAPIYLGNVTTASGTKNLLFIVTNNGTLLALDADTITLSVVWSKQPASGGPTAGSPAVDPSLQYVYAYALDGKVHKYQVGDGTEVSTGGWPEISTLKPDVEKGAAGLSIATAQNATTYLYSVTDGYIGDSNDYQGHITAINLATGAQNVFNSECSDKTIHFCKSGAAGCSAANDCASTRNGIWGRPGAVYDAGTDRLFITTGNGPYDPTNAAGQGINWGDSVLALNPAGTGGPVSGMPVDSYTPTTFGSATHGDGLQGNDADLGSESIAIVPAPSGTAVKYQHIAVQTGKDGCVRLINLADLSGNNAPAHTGGELQALDFPGGSNCATGGDGPELRSQPAIWVNPDDGASWIYVASISNGFAAYKVGLDGAGKPSLSQQWTATSGTSPIVAGRTVYYQSSSHLRALDAVNGATAVLTTSIWGTTSFSSQHWQSPILVNGRVYVIDNANPSQLWVYQLDGIFKNGFN